jgi:glyoxylase-like metal-dependent hydrolase (beta-lactamase superfamily II)
MLIETFEAGLVATNGYVVADHPGGQALIVDAPQGAATAMVAQADRWNAPVAFLINTHAHWDHYWDNAAVLRQTRAKFGIHRESAPLLKLPQARMFGLETEIEPSHPDFFLEEGTPLAIGNLTFEILHCPGHCPGSVVLFERRERVAFVGDVLFAGAVGRTDLPGGSTVELLSSIREKLLPLGDDVRVFAGHGPVTTLGAERCTNPFLVGGH